MQPGSRELIRDINRTLVLNLVRELGPISRADVARESGLSPSTVTAIVAELFDQGFLLEADTGERRAPAAIGRPGTLLAVNPSAGYVVGIKVAAETVTVTLTDLAAEPLTTDTLPRAAHLEADATADMLASAVEMVAASAGVDRHRLLGVGIGVPGVVDPDSGRVTKSPLLEWGSYDIVGLVSDRTGLPVHIDNDVNTLTIAEQLFGAGRSHAHFIVVTVGRGIGMGAVLSGVLYRGVHGGAGELGHVAVAPDGPACWCGRRGCLESIAAEPALVREVLAATGHLIQPGDLGAAAARDGRVARILGHAGAEVGRSVANVVAVLDPDLVVVGGEGVRLGGAFLGPMREALEAAQEEGQREIEVVVEPWGDEAWARGAATLVLRELFHPARLRSEPVPSQPRATPARSATPARAGQGGRTR